MAERTLDKLKQHNQQIEQQLDDLVSAGSQFEPHALNQVLNEIISHCNAEVSALFPEAQQVQGLNQVLSQAEQAHQQLEKCISKLIGPDMAKEKALDDIRQLHSLFSQHEKQINNELLPRLEQSISSDRLDMILENMQAFEHTNLAKQLG